MINWRFPAAVQFIAVAPEAQRCQAALPFNYLAVDIVNIGTIGFFTEKRLPRIRGAIIGNVQHAAVHGGNQHVNLRRNGALRVRFNFQLHIQVAVRPHFSRRVEG